MGRMGRMGGIAETEERLKSLSTASIPSIPRAKSLSGSRNRCRTSPRSGLPQNRWALTPRRWI